MTLLHEAVEAKKFDTRMIERNVARGVVKSELADQYLKSLPDDAESAEWISIETLTGEQSQGENSGENAANRG